MILITFSIVIEGQAKYLELLIPYKTIEPIKEQMQQVFLGDKFNIDQDWERMLADNVHNIELSIEAVITDKISTVKEVSNLKIGDTIVMDHAKDKEITVRTGSIPIFTGHIGKVENKLAINLKHFIKE